MTGHQHFFLHSCHTWLSLTECAINRRNYGAVAGYLAHYDDALKEMFL
jgi:hypothetical protein